MKPYPERGAICLVCLDPAVDSEISKTRPAVIVSNDINNRVASTVTVIPVTSKTGTVYPFETFLPARETGLPEDSKAKCNQIRTIDKKRLIKSLGKVSAETMKEIEEALRVHLGMYDAL